MGFVRLISQSFYLLTDAITYLLIPCLYGPLWAWTSLIVDAHSSLSTAFCRHLLTFTSRRFFSTSSSHRNLGLPLLLLPFGLLSHFFLTVFPCFVLTTCPIHSSLGRFTPWKKKLLYPVSGRLGGTQSRSGCFVVGRSSLLLLGIEPRLLCFIICTLVIVPTVLWSSVHVPNLWILKIILFK